MRALLVLILLLGAAAIGADEIATRPGPLPAARAVVVPRGSAADVARALEADGVIGAALPFRIAAFATRRRGPIHAAELAFPAHASLLAVLDVLRHGHPVEHRLTIPEGWTAAEIARALAAADALAGPVPVPPEGAVLPQTYDYERGTTRTALLGRTEAAMRAALDRAWTARDPAGPLRSRRALLILASMVEHETHLAAERPIVAAVFLNRLRLGMRLQSDPTVAYAAAGGLGPLGRPLTRADLAAPNPYNTYTASGLPPGPIGAPGLASLEAAARPAATAALYFVADGSGGHAFSDTLAEQDRNVAHLRALAGSGAGAPGTAAPAEPGPAPQAR